MVTGSNIMSEFIYVGWMQRSAAGWLMAEKVGAQDQLDGRIHRDVILLDEPAKV